MLMIEVDELTDYLDEYLEEKQEVKNLTSETIQKQTFNISKFIEYLENEMKILYEHKNNLQILKDNRWNLKWMED